MRRRLQNRRAAATVGAQAARWVIHVPTPQSWPSSISPVSTAGSSPPADPVRACSSSVISSPPAFVSRPSPRSCDGNRNRKARDAAAASPSDVGGGVRASCGVLVQSCPESGSAAAAVCRVAQLRTSCAQRSSHRSPSWRAAPWPVSRNASVQNWTMRSRQTLSRRVRLTMSSWACGKMETKCAVLKHEFGMLFTHEGRLTRHIRAPKHQRQARASTGKLGRIRRGKEGFDGPQPSRTRLGRTHAPLLLARLWAGRRRPALR